MSHRGIIIARAWRRPLAGRAISGGDRAMPPAATGRACHMRDNGAVWPRLRAPSGGSNVRYVYIGLIVAVTALVLLFKVQNLETVTVSLFSASISLPVSVLIVGIYLLGMFTGGFVVDLLRSWIGGARGRN